MTNYKHISVEAINEMADGENEFIVEILNNCLETMGPNIDILSEGAKTNDTQTVLFQAHKLKGSFRFIGATEIASILETIEHEAAAGTLPANVTDMSLKVKEMYAEIEREIKAMLAGVSD